MDSFCYEKTVKIRSPLIFFFFCFCKRVKLGICKICLDNENVSFHVISSLQLSRIIFVSLLHIITVDASCLAMALVVLYDNFV